MSAYKHSEACCKVPPVVTSGYEAKGKYIELDGMKTCMNLFHLTKTWDSPES